MKKRSISLLLALLMVFSLVPGALAQAQATNVDLLTEEQGGLNSMVVRGGELLIYGYKGLYAYKPGDFEARLITEAGQRFGQTSGGAEEYFDLLLADGDQLYGYQSNNGVLIPLTLEGDKLSYGKPVTLDVSSQAQEMDGGSFVNTPEQLLIQDGRLYTIFKSYEASGPKTSLLSFDVAAGGAPTPIDAPFVQRLSGYKDGLLLALVLDESNAFDRQTGQMRAPAIATLDPKSGALSEIGSSVYPFEGGSTSILYDPANDVVYEMGSGEVSRRDAQGKSEVCAYLGSSQLWGFSAGQMLLIDPDTIAVGSGQGVYVRSTDPAKLPDMRLTIYGSFESAEHRKASKAMNDLPVNYLNSKWFASAQELGQALVSGEDGIDLLFLSSSQLDLNMLMRKGYAADLSGSQILQDFVASIYPEMREVAKLDGKLLMVPVAVNAQALGYYPGAFEKVGAKVPETYQDLVDLITNWSKDYAPDHPDVVLMAQPSYGQFLLGQAIALYADYCGYTGQEFNFSAPELMNMMKQALEADTKDLDIEMDFNSPESQNVWNELYNKEQLLDSYGNLDVQGLTQVDFARDESRSYLPSPLTLAVKEGAPRVTRVDLTLMVVNPKSKHLEAAIQYAEQYVQALDLKTRTMLDPSLNEAVEQPDWELQVKQMDEGLATFERAAEQAEGAEKTEMLAQVKEFRENIETAKEQMRWQVSPKAIEIYRQFMETSYVTNYDLMMILSQEGLQMLMMRLAKRQMPLEQFASEADATLRLIRLENQ